MTDGRGEGPEEGAPEPLPDGARQVESHAEDVDLFS